MNVVNGSHRSWALEAIGRAVTIGVYDGVHLGHRTVFSLLLGEAEESGLEPTIVTFDRHPLAVVSPEHVPPLLTTLEHRLELFAESGFATAAVLDFEEVRDLDPGTFAESVLHQALTTRLVVVGEDFRFGRDRLGHVGLMADLGAQQGFRAMPVPLVGGEAPVSSTVIRRLVAAGDVVAAAEALGRPHELRGTVVRGEGRGASIGVPTANLQLPPGVAVPARGVYAVRAGVDELGPGVANIGVRPTFGGDAEMLEVHLIGDDVDLYGRVLRVAFVDRIRDERRFDGVDELVAQIHRDIDEANRLLG